MKFSWLKQWRSKTQIHGALFDLGVFLGSWGLLTLNPATLADGWVGLLLVTAVSTQIGGAYLKGRYLPARLPPLKPGLFARFMLLLLLHFILFTVMTLMGLALIGWYQPDASGEGWWVAGAFVLGGAATWLVYSAAQPAPPDDQPQQNGRIEYAADALLWLSVLITTNLMWEALFTDLGTEAGAGFSLRGIVLALALSLLFAAFYLPSRYLFLVEDYRHPSTWLRLWVVLLPQLITIFQN